MAKRLTREESRALTRAKLLASAREVMARDGYEGASIDRIAEEAGFSKGAFYSNFSSKEEIFLELLETHSLQDVDEIAEALEGVDDPTQDHRGDQRLGRLPLDRFELGHARARAFPPRQAGRDVRRPPREPVPRPVDRHRPAADEAVPGRCRPRRAGGARRHRLRAHLRGGLELRARTVGRRPGPVDADLASSTRTAGRRRPPPPDRQRIKRSSQATDRGRRTGTRSKRA